MILNDYYKHVTTKEDAVEVVKSIVTDSRLEPYSPTCKFFEDHLEQRIQHLRKLNDNSSLSHERTCGIRGEIKACKDLLALIKKAKEE